MEFTLKLCCGSYDSHDLSATMFSLVVIKPQSHSVRKGRSQCIVEGSQEFKQEPESRHRGRDDRGMLLFTGLLQSLLNNLPSTAQDPCPGMALFPVGSAFPHQSRKWPPNMTIDQFDRDSSSVEDSSSRMCQDNNQNQPSQLPW